MKGLLFIVILTCNIAYGQDTKGYFLSDTIQIKKIFHIEKQYCFTDYHSPQKVVKGGHFYSSRVRKYYGGRADTSFFRNEGGTYYSWSRKTRSETIEVPKDAHEGQSWYQSDSTWKYVISKVNAKLKTPRKTYSNLLVIQASQINGLDEKKFLSYDNYYAKGIGFIGSIVDGELVAYLESVDIKAAWEVPITDNFSQLASKSPKTCTNGGQQCVHAMLAEEHNLIN